MSRVPFIGLPTGCDQLSFDIDIVPTDFTMCSVPGVTSATQLPVTFHIDMPDLVVPPFCPCMPTHSFSKSDYDIVRDTKKAGFYYTIAPATGDCCEPEFDMNFNLVIPCMPLEASSTGTIKLTLATDVSATMHLTKSDSTCALAFEYDINIPCLPLELTRVQHTSDYPEPAKETVFASLYMGTGCTLYYDIGLELVGASGAYTRARDIAWVDNCLKWRYDVHYYVKGRCDRIYQDQSWHELICATYC
jgi:hypothetical protein